MMTLLTTDLMTTQWIHLSMNILYDRPQVDVLTLCKLETPKLVLWQTVKTQMKCSIMLHFIRFFAVC